MVAENVTVPDPVPLDPDATARNDESEAAVQEHVGSVTTPIVPVPAEKGMSSLDGDRAM